MLRGPFNGTCPQGGRCCFKVSKGKLKSGEFRVTPPHISSEELKRRVVAGGVSKVISQRSSTSAAKAIAGALGGGPERVDGPREVTLTSGKSFVVPVVPVGFAKKGKRARGPRMTKEQLEFVKWCYGRGLVNPSQKIDPRKAQLLMELHGTTMGAAKFSGDDYWKATATGESTFMVIEQLTHYQFRPWFSNMKNVFATKIAAAIAKAVGADDVSDDE